VKLQVLAATVGKKVKISSPFGFRLWQARSQKGRQGCGTQLSSEQLSVVGTMLLSTTGKGTAFSRADKLRLSFRARVKLVPFPTRTARQVKIREEDSGEMG
jgi:hypothetical protein